MHRPKRVKNMKLPATESKGETLSATSVKASIQAPVKRLAKSLASARQASAGQASAGRKNHTQTKAAQKNVSRPKQSQEEAAKQANASQSEQPRSRANESSKRQSAIPNIPLIQNSKAARVTFTLLLVRPWVLVAGLWVLSLLSSAVAIKGLIRPSILTQALPEAIVEAPPVATSSIINVVEGDAETGDVATAKTEAIEEIEPVETAAEPAQGNLPIGLMVALTGTCAAGCLVMARRRAMARMSVARSKQRVRRKPIRPDAVRKIATAQSLKQVRKPASSGQQLSHERSASSPAANARTANARPTNLRPAGAADADARGMSRVKKRRQRNKRVATTQNLGTQTRKSGQVKTRKAVQKPASHPAAQRSGSAYPARPRRVKRSASHTARRQSVVSVVPAGNSHALDWENGSLAHQMDVRNQPRTAAM